MSAVTTVIKEQIKSFYLVRRLSVFQLKMNNNKHYLGILWEFLNPLIQIMTYWFVFGYLTSGGKPRTVTHGHEVYPFFLYLLSGVVLWFFLNPAILEGSKSIYTRLNMVAKMNFPMSVIPSFVILSKFYTHLLLVVVAAVILNLSGQHVSIYYLQLPYYMFAMLALMLAISLITSTLSTIVRDVQMLLSAFMRILFYISPILWSNRFHGHKTLEYFLKLNPVQYLVDGYRSSLLYGEWYFVNHWVYTLYFWILVIVLFIVGATLHVKFRKRFVDFM